MAKRDGARARIREFMESNVGKVVTTQQIREVAQISEYGRRIRELRNEEGMQISSHNDRTDLKPGEYVLETLELMPGFGRGISLQQRMEILERNGFTCQQCGAGPGDPDIYNPGRTVRMHIDHIVPVTQGGTNDPSNLRTLCSMCNQGRSNISMPSEGAKNIIARIRKEPANVQREIYEMLSRKFGERE